VASARPRRASKRLDCRLWTLSSTCIRKGKIVIAKTSKQKGLVLGSFLGPETDMFEALIVNSVLVFVPLMRFYIGTAQLKKVLVWA
jgi:hypothetical protein